MAKKITIPADQLRKLKIALFDYNPYLDRKGDPCQPFPAPFEVGDVVVIKEYDPEIPVDQSKIDGVGVVLGCISQDGELRTDLSGMVSFDYLEAYNPEKHTDLPLYSKIKDYLVQNNLI